MRVAHRHGADLDGFGAHLEGIARGFGRGLEGQRAGIEVRDAHVHGNEVVRPDPCLDEPSGAVQGHRAVAVATAVMEQGGDAPRPVAALLHFGAVRIEDPVEDRRLRAPRRFEYQGLIEADSGVPVGELPQPLGRGERAPGRCLENDEVVADPVHLREIDAHGERITESAGLP